MNSSDEENDFRILLVCEDSSDKEMIEKRIQVSSKIRKNNMGKQTTGSPIPIEQQRVKQRLKNHNEYEKVFDIHVFATDEEAKEELEMRKNSEPYLSAEYKCWICYAVYKGPKLLEYHMRGHHPSAGDHGCEVCHMRFEKRQAVTSHKLKVHYGKFTCKKCPKITYQKTVMANHYRYHMGVIFECELCNHTFHHPSAFNFHKRTCHESNHVCVTCARTFVSEKGLYAHRNKAHKTKSKVDIDASAHCAPCGLTFANEQVYTVHIMNTKRHRDLANSMVTVACKACGVRFENEEDLKEHRHSQHPKYSMFTNCRLVNMKTSDEDACKCPICGVMGTSHYWIFRHIASAHPDSPYVEDLAKRRRHMCETCGKSYTTKAALRDHMNLHSGAKPFACPSCYARFRTRAYLAVHQDRHKPPKRECPHCGNKFFSAANLSNHMRIHIQDRRYKCSVCDKGFLHAGSLREHERGVHHSQRRRRRTGKENKRRAVTDD